MLFASLRLVYSVICLNTLWDKNSIKIRISKRSRSLGTCSKIVTHEELICSLVHVWRGMAWLAQSGQTVGTWRQGSLWLQYRLSPSQRIPSVSRSGHSCSESDHTRHSATSLGRKSPCCDWRWKQRLGGSYFLLYVPCCHYSICECLRSCPRLVTHGSNWQQVLSPRSCRLHGSAWCPGWSQTLWRLVPP